jgi:hypothetical protein
VVATAFLPAPGDNETDVDHINTKRDDNRFENLQWLTKQAHGVKTARDKADRAEMDEYIDSLLAD